MDIKPVLGGSIRPFGAGWFIMEFLKGHAPEGSARIDPAVGSTMSDIHAAYKDGLFRANARDMVDKEEELRIKKGGHAFNEEEDEMWFEYYLRKIPYKFLKMRYSSFARYFGHLKRLGWVEATGRTEPSAIQDYYPPAPSRVFYRLTEAGSKATPTAISDPLMALYHYSRAQRSAKSRRYTP